MPYVHGHARQLGWVVGHHRRPHAGEARQLAFDDAPPPASGVPLPRAAEPGCPGRPAPPTMAPARRGRRRDVVAAESARVTVWVAGWQMGCCGEDFAVGDRVSWWLVGERGDWYAERVGLDVGWRAELPVRAHGRLGADPEPAVLGSGELHVLLVDRPAADESRVRVASVLMDSHHCWGSRLPCTAASVESIEDAFWDYAPQPGDTPGLEPVLGSGRLEPARTARRRGNPADHHGWRVVLAVRTADG